jgi:uncharacterized damage-inducible protein DinB
MTNLMSFRVRVRAAAAAGVLLAVTPAIVAQTSSAAPANNTMAALRHGFVEVSGWITQSAALVAPDKYTYKPVATVRSFGELVAHAIDGYNYYCASAASGKRAQWSDATATGKTDKATLAAKLKQATDACTAAYDTSTHVEPLMANIAHANLHYGNMVTYLRMLGLKPPSS